MKSSRNLPIAWLIGGSSKLGLSVANHLGNTYQVINFSRRVARPESELFHNVQLDLANIPNLRNSIQENLVTHSPRAIIFCQRYRPKPDSIEIDSLTAVNIEILSTQCIIDSLIKREGETRCSIVIISSLNGIFMDKRIPFLYHWLKSSQISLVKYYSVSNGNKFLNVNCIAPGSFLKEAIEAYPLDYKRQMEDVRQLTPLKKNATVDDISRLAVFLISDQAMMINGQVVAVDGGISNIFQETLI